MKVPCCSVCHTRYDESERVPLLLHCGHGFCKACLAHMFAAAVDTAISCPRCRHPTTVGNSVHALRKNFSILSLLGSSPSFECDFTNEDGLGDDEEEDADDEYGGDYFGSRGRRLMSHLSNTSVSGCCAAAGSKDSSLHIDLSSHHDLKLLRRLGEGRRAGHETWSAVLSGGSSSAGAAAPEGRGGKCRHQVAVKRVAITEEMDVVWVQNRLENLRRSAMWCRDVCTFHGAKQIDNHLCLIMDRYNGSILSEMQQNNGRLTLEQILRYGADIARGVVELHAAGIVCMNLKPSNLLLDENSHVVVSDYGLQEILKRPSCRKARSVPEEPSSRMHSCMDCTMLSPHYTAPEAWEPLKKSLFWDDAIGISAESDAWSFGCTLVEMCTGSIPWAGLSSEEIYRAVVKARRTPPQYSCVVGGGIPRELWKMIGECLQFKAARRPTFSTMLSIFLRHLQEVPRSPPASPENDFTKTPTDAIEPSPPSVLESLQDNPSVLHRLVSEGRLQQCEGLIPNGIDDEGESLLHKSISRRGPELVRILLAAGANPTAQDEHFRTAFGYTAAMVNDAELLKRYGVGDWVKSQEASKLLHMVGKVWVAWSVTDSIGTVLCVDDDGILRVGFPEPRGWRADPAEMERFEEFKVGDWVRVKASVPSPKYGWEDVTPKQHWGDP
ncbi:hypothetical protein J5N97_014297 [Dioscorea zingiberensis]|uniref:RING-type E3 ubiquitin transferase n=1 Tax=Dioscorea zingiberensis TaxID=325984 RepID=A0A9D5CT74_9LILI|nr:hypothetical protein J5N97_014297 [Dioscorea zingiberensis]